LTTVGYGDMYPVTAGGQFFTFFVLMIGLGVIAVPTGLITSALNQAREEEKLNGSKFVQFSYKTITKALRSFNSDMYKRCNQYDPTFNLIFQYCTLVVETDKCFRIHQINVV